MTRPASAPYWVLAGWLRSTTVLTVASAMVLTGCLCGEPHTESVYARKREGFAGPALLRGLLACERLQSTRIGEEVCIGGLNVDYQDTGASLCGDTVLLSTDGRNVFELAFAHSIEAEHLRRNAGRCDLRVFDPTGEIVLEGCLAIEARFARSGGLDTVVSLSRKRARVGATDVIVRCRNLGHAESLTVSL